MIVIGSLLIPIVHPFPLLRGLPGKFCLAEILKRFSSSLPLFASGRNVVVFYSV